MAIPEEFLNSFYVELGQTGLEEFLTVRGVPWLVRKFISGKLKNGTFHLAIEGDGYVYQTGDPNKGLEYRFKLGQKFVATGYDGKKHEITISMDKGKLKEVHLNLERENVGEDTFYYYFIEEQLMSDCTCTRDGKTATWHREFRKKY